MVLALVMQQSTLHQCLCNLCHNSLKQLLFIMVHYGTAFNNPVNHVASSSSYTQCTSCMNEITLRPAILACCMFLALWLSNPKYHSTMSEIMLCPAILTCCVLLALLLPNPKSHSTMSEIMLCRTILTCHALLVFCFQILALIPP